MDETRTAADEGRQEGDAVEARVERSWSSVLIWALPAAALLLVGYLVARELLRGGTTVTVAFPTTQGVTAGDTKVRYRGVEVGKVSAVHLQDDLGGVEIELSLQEAIAEGLRSGARFWVEQPGVLSGNLSNLLAGPHVAMEPGDGDETSRFVGLLEPPPLRPRRPGTAFVVHAPRAGGVQRDTPVRHRGLEAGRVLDVSLAGEDRVRIDLFVREPFDRLVSPASHFWRCGGLDVSGDGGGLGVDLPGAESLAKGCVAFDTFQADAQPAAESGRDFRLYESEEAARHAPLGTPVPLVVHFPGPVGDLSAGAPVELAGQFVGEVRAVELVVDPQPARVRTPVTVELYPHRFGLAPDAEPAALYELLDRLVGEGLRAQLGSSRLVLGQPEVSLVMTDAQADAQLDRRDSPPSLPATAGGDLQSVMATMGRIADSLDAVPIRDIGRNLDATLANTREVTAEARQQVEPMLEQLRQASRHLESVSTALDEVAGGTVGGQDNLEELIEEVTWAARSVRTLASYLERHPEALVVGRE